jgi:hypothetical protein
MWLGECPIAVGSEAQIMYASDGGADLEQIAKGSIDDPTLAEIELFHHDLLVRPRTAATAAFHIELVDGTKFDGAFEFADRTHTRTTSSLESAVVGARALVYSGSPFTVYAEHLDKLDRPLLGHGLEQWSATGGVLIPAAPFGTLDPQRTRSAIAGDARVITVRARPDATPLQVDVAPPGSAAHLELNYGVSRLWESGVITLDHHTAVVVDVRPFTSGQRLLNGAPRRGGLSAVTDNPAVATVKLLPGARAFELSTLSSGTTVLTLRFDGLERRFRIAVPTPS